MRPAALPIRITPPPKCYSYVRFSTPEQSQGDSLRRQLEYATDYAERKGLHLDKTLSLRDLGLSGFHGDNRTKGALGQFLRHVAAGRIARGSILIVESLDRLSRQEILTALNLFTEIIQGGMTIVTAIDGQEYTEDSINANPMQLMLSLVSMTTAHDESSKKSKRLGKAWEGKRERALSGERKLTGRAPEWLSLTEDKKRFEIIPERAKVIEQIFQMKLAGVGKAATTRTLNKQQEWIPGRKGNERGWRPSYIQKILLNRSVIGECQPHKLAVVDGKKVRIPVGDAISGYYPRVVSDELFYGVQKQFEKNKRLVGNGGGKNGKCNNLLSYIARCGYCGAPMTFVNKGEGGKYLVCDDARRGRGCKYGSVHYEEVEHLVLEYCKGLTARDLFPKGNKTPDEVDSLRGNLVAIEARISEAELQIENLTDTIASTTDKRVRTILNWKLSAVLDSRETLEGQKAALQEKIDALAHLVDKVQMTVDDLNGLLDMLDNVEGEERSLIRMKLRNELRRLIERIDVFPFGAPNWSEKAIAEFFEENGFEDWPDLRPIVEEDLRGRIDNKKCREYKVIFKGGSRRKLMPSRQSPLVTDFDAESMSLQCFYERDGKTEMASFSLEDIDGLF
ncbi:MAG: recombinase family protein [Syntrophobacteraceae bacterium]